MVPLSPGGRRSAGARCCYSYLERLLLVLLLQYAFVNSYWWQLLACCSCRGSPYALSAGSRNRETLRLLITLFTRQITPSRRDSQASPSLQPR
jgi:hypothetical protein